MEVLDTKDINGKSFTLIENGLSHNIAINKCQAYRHENIRDTKRHGKSGYKRHLYRIQKTDNGYGIFCHKRSELSY